MKYKILNKSILITILSIGLLDQVQATELDTILEGRHHHIYDATSSVHPSHSVSHRPAGGSATLSVLPDNGDDGQEDNDILLTLTHKQFRVLSVLECVADYGGNASAAIGSLLMGISTLLPQDHPAKLSTGIAATISGGIAVICANAHSRIKAVLRKNINTHAQRASKLLQSQSSGDGSSKGVSGADVGATVRSLERIVKETS